MTRRTRRNLQHRCLAVAGMATVALFASSPLFAQAQATVEVSATVVAPVQQQLVTSAAVRFASLDPTTTQVDKTELLGGVASVRTRRVAAARGEPAKPTVVTLEYAAN